MSFDPSTFIASIDWHFAKTMPENPHEWTHQRHAPDRAAFDAFVAYIQGSPKVRRFAGRPYRYIEVDGWTIWLTYAGGYIGNRKPTADAGWDSEPADS